MAENTNNRLTGMLLSKSRRAQYLKVFAVLAACVVVAVAIILHQNGVAMTHEEQVLTCPVTGVVAHTHNESCYDKDGNLVCTLPERELHVHDDSCYTETRTLICGQEESDQHQHTDACYNVSRDLTCGKEEVTEEHVHGPGCFTTVTVQDADDNASANDGEVTVQPSTNTNTAEGAAASQPTLPAQSFTGLVKDQNDKVVLQVEVTAPEGAFPANTTMKIAAIDSKDVKDSVDKAVTQKSADGVVKDLQAVDITFFNAAGQEIEPLCPITVSMTSDKIANEDTNPVLVHVDDKGKGEVVDQLSDNQAAERKVETSDNTLAFDADSFSVYVIAYTVDFHYDVDGETYDFSIPGGGFVSFTDLIEVLGVAEGTNAEDNAANVEESTGENVLTLSGTQVSDKTKKFVADVERVEFSSPDLVWIGKVESDSTVGGLKEANGLDVQYSAELTKEQIEQINAQTVKSGDWALISKLPFLSEESLTVTMKNGEVFTIKVTDAQIVKDYITASGETYTITVTYDDSAEIPNGADLKVEEIERGTEEYNQYLSDSEAILDEEKGIVSFARFFDIQILDANGKRVEPKSPVKVKIEYKDALQLEESDTLSVVHFAETKKSGQVTTEPEVIEDVAVNAEATEILYEQGSFSVTGTVVQTPVEEHKYALVIHHTDGNYYVVENDGTLAKIPTNNITFNGNGSVQSVKMVNPICWTYHSIGYGNYTIYHDTDARAYDVPGTSLPTAYTRRYLSADVPAGYADLNDDANPWNLNNRDYCPDDGRYVNIQYNANHTLNHYNHVLGVAENPDGTLHVIGQAAQAAEIYFAEARGVPSVSPQNHTVNHIDISVEGSAGIKFPLAYGTYKLAKVNDRDLENIDNITDLNRHIIGYRNTDLVVDHVNEVTLDVERMVPITQNDIKKADITAYAIRNGQTVYLDDVYAVTGYSGNAETSSDTPQVRLEGAFKVADMNPVSGNEDQANNDNYYENGRNLGKIKEVRLQRPIHYTVAVNKPVTFTMTYKDTDGQTYVVLKDDGTPFRITVDVSLSSSFTYFDEDNTCPGIDLWTYGRDRWRKGEIRSNGNFGSPLDVGPGFDFRLGASKEEAGHDTVAIEVTKYVQGDFGNEVRTLSLQEGTTCDINVYQNDNTTALHKKTLSVGKDGIGLINDYDVAGGTYQNPAKAQISEDPNSVADVVVDADGKQWVYDHSRVETEFAWRNDGKNNPKRYVSGDYTKTDGQYMSASEVIGEYTVQNGKPYVHNGQSYDGVHEYNRFLEFYVYNIYKRAGYLKINKQVTMNGATPSTDADKQRLAGTYEFKVYTDEACTQPYIKEDGNPLTLSVKIGTDGQAKGSEIVMVPLGDYWIKEDTPANGARPTQEKVTVTVGDNATESNPAVAEFTNDLALSMDINILKVDSTDANTPLTGAKFTLKRYDENYLRVIQDKTEWTNVQVSNEGTLSFTDLNPGYYEIEETETPVGYVKTSANPRFEIKANTNGSPEVVFENTGMVTYSASNKTFTVKNEPGEALPETGGSGTKLYTIVGSILVAGAGAMLVMQRRRSTE